VNSFLFVFREVVQNIMGRQGKFLEYDRLSETWVVVHPTAALDFTFKSLNASIDEDESNEEN
jgi:hypothetical protein